MRWWKSWHSGQEGVVEKGICSTARVWIDSIDTKVRTCDYLLQQRRNTLWMALRVMILFKAHRPQVHPSIQSYSLCDYVCGSIDDVDQDPGECVYIVEDHYQQQYTLT